MSKEAAAAFAKAGRLIEKARRDKATELDLSGMGLTALPERLGQLTALQSLSLSRNQLTALPERLGQLTALQELSLSRNQLTALPERLGQLTALQELYLSGNQLTALPERLGQLTALQSLNLFNNQLTALPESLGQLTALQRLDLSFNQLTALPERLGQLTALQSLNLFHNQLTALPERLGQLTALQTLGISRNQLTALPESLGQLTALRELYLSDNQLTALPEWLGQLTALQMLSLTNNQLTALPESLRKLTKLTGLFLHGNPGLGLSDEMLGLAWEDVIHRNKQPKPPAQILDYYFRTARPGAALPLNEFKLILVGRGGVGKTTLVHRLVKEKYKEFKRTPGINITQWPRQMGGAAVHAHVWDFGGQEIMHGTHRFFMTERALYLVLLSGREGTEDRDAEYWLSLVRSFAGDVPVIVLLHKWDDYHFELNREQLREKYGRNIVFLETDSSSGQGIEKLCEEISRQALKLPGLKAAWPKDWRRVKDELPARKKSWLTYGEFCEFCRERGVPDARDQGLLADSLHDLGLMLSYRKDEALRDFGVLNPQWVTRGIYEMLNSRVMREAGGKFTLKTFGSVLSRNSYPQALHGYLLALMRKFWLCHPLDDKGVNYLVPELLTKKEPKLDDEFPPEKCLGFIYRYDAVLPEGLLPRFIVATYVHGEPERAWRTGVVLKRANCRALVRGDVTGRKITIRVTGPGNGQRELLGIIREHFEHIHGDYEKLPVTEMVPIPGHPNAHVKHELLLKYERDGRQEIAVEVGDELKDFSVKTLLDGVDLPGVSREGSLWGRRLHAGSELSIFISYAHKDELYRDELRGALTAYERKGELRVWDDTRIMPGQKWESEILGNLERADIIVLLLSNDFIRSDYCMTKEMKRALERDAAGKCAIVPIVVRACRFDKLEVGKIQAILPGGKPIKSHRDRDAAWQEVTKQLDRVIAELKPRVK